MRRLLAPVVALSLLALAACGSGGKTSGSTEPGGTTKLKVGVIPIVDVAPIYLGKEKGFFAQHKIDLELVQQSGGAAAIPGVIAGDFQLAFGNVTSVLLAGSQNLPLRIVANGVSSTGDPKTDFAGVVVPADSPLQSPKDLAGKTVAINNLKNINDVTTRAIVEKAGGDPASVKFVELGFPDMPAAVANHKVDAAAMVEPFLSASISQGARVIGAQYADATANLTVASYFATQQYVSQNKAVIDNFRAALQQSMQYAQEHPDEVRRIVTTYTTIKADVAQKIKLPAWPQETNVDSLKTVAELMRKYGHTQSTVDVNKLIATG
ncbi:ABC transporter substrate-binding protein [Planosporangium mesophilum]|uniref:Thiamine biosynthesis protein n=1 Tax=Planosporangium mesophilum TaxID=689768 RepID=A0A8J3TBI3_9ACTN|nr:ABC transporter substrate-binding protein [Planosporangium mesophilum]NJC85404.1 ABC transporter substrate-binding protein [Planosporangium mesophilum]GII24085.1 thiamine biosynthesis protein [Planosporangium mesophilum]